MKTKNIFVRRTIELTIIAMSYCAKGFCFLGLDAQDRLYRPVPQDAGDALVWPNKLEVCKTYKFTVCDAPNFPHANPHLNEGIIVEREPKAVGGISQKELKSRLATMAKTNLEAIFAAIEESKNGSLFVRENTYCHSAGVLKCPIASLRTRKQEAKTKLRIKIKETFDCEVPVGAFKGYDNPGRQSSTEYLVVLDLGRPFKPKGWKFSACFVSAVGLLAL